MPGRLRAVIDRFKNQDSRIEREMLKNLSSDPCAKIMEMLWRLFEIGPVREIPRPPTKPPSTAA